jgi:ribosomal protein S18 acetylase RimI-like enzyme
MALADYPAAAALWSEAEGVCMSESDAPEAVARYLARNPGLSQVAVAGGRLVGAILCGHDGRRGFMYHLAVAPGWRRRGVARAMVERCLAALAAAGIPRCNIHVLHTNEAGRRFWEAMGWQANERALTMWFDNPSSSAAPPPCGGK